MPYKVYKGAGGQHCVHKENPDGSAGKKIACHATRTKANAQLRALYANEDKEMANVKDSSMKIELDVSDELKETVSQLEEKHMGELEYVPWGVYSFAELEKAQDARAVATRIKGLSDQFVEIVSNIMSAEEINDKSMAVSTLSAEYSALIGNKADKENENSGWLDDVKAIVKETMDNIFVRKPKENTGFMIWKEGDSLRWLARYSNNFRDDDYPPEIISAKSHQRFVEMVDKNEAPMPELWLWHRPEWKLGKADWLAYDDSGFAIASGTIDRGKEIFAEQIAKQKLVGVSHGMPVVNIVRDPDDPTIIVQHTTTEISPLPHAAAANKRANWVLLGESLKEEGNNMPIPEQKKRDLIDQWNMDPELLTQLETVNSVDADKAVEEGVESKEASEAKVEDTEKDVVEVTEEVTETEVAETAEPDTTPVDSPPSRTEIAEAIATVLKPYVELVDNLNGRMKELEKSDEVKVTEKAALTPSASVSALLAQQFSAIGDSSTRLDKRKKLAKSGPEEADDVAGEGPMPIGILNQIVADKEVTIG